MTVSKYQYSFEGGSEPTRSKWTVSKHAFGLANVPGGVTGTTGHSTPVEVSQMIVTFESGRGLASNFRDEGHDCSHVTLGSCCCSLACSAKSMVGLLL